jgi:hypothetical protein
MYSYHTKDNADLGLFSLVLKGQRAILLHGRGEGLHIIKPCSKNGDDYEK